MNMRAAVALMAMAMGFSGCASVAHQPSVPDYGVASGMQAQPLPRCQGGSNNAGGAAASCLGVMAEQAVIQQSLGH